MLSDRPVLTEHDVAAPSSRADGHQRPKARAAPQMLTDDLRNLERERIVQMLAEERGNKRAVAARLGLSRRTLYRRLERYGLLSRADAAAVRFDDED